MIKNFLLHKRNTSETIKIEPRTKQSFSQKHKKSKQSTVKNKSNTLSLIQKSNKKIPNKYTVIQQLDESQQNKSSPFFAFGQRAGNGQHKNWHLDVDKISEVQDSNSRRDFTSHRSARENYGNLSKQNYNTSNFEQGLRKSAKSKSNKHKSKQKSLKSSKSRNQKTKSTISLSRVKNSKQIELRTQKMEKSVKMLWECMGQLWQNSRVSQYRSEKNNESINNLKRKLEEQQQRLLQIKFQLSRAEKHHQKPPMSLRA